MFAYPFRDPAQVGQPYWRDVGTLDSFWEANMELVMPEPQLVVRPYLANLDIPRAASSS